MLQAVREADDVVASLRLLGEVRERRAVALARPAAALGVDGRIGEVEDLEARRGEELARDEAEVAVPAAGVEPSPRRA